MAIFKNKKVVYTNNMKNIEVKTVEETKVIKELVSVVLGTYDYVEYKAIDKTTTYVYKVAKLNKDINLQNSFNIHSTTNYLFKKGTKLILKNEVEDRRERGLKPLYSFILPTGESYPLYEEEFTWVGEETEIIEERIALTGDNSKRYFSLELGEKAKNTQIVKKIKDTDGFNREFSMDEKELLNKYVSEMYVDESYVDVYFKVLTKLRNLNKEINRLNRYHSK